jgi:predicted RNA binding protein YcfA (HicA-like mRNA interferase family)
VPLNPAYKPGLTGHVPARKLKKFGFEGPYRGGKHPFMVKGSLVLTIPNPHKKEISVDLLTRILRQANIEKEEWIEVD